MKDTQIGEKEKVLPKIQRAQSNVQRRDIKDTTITVIWQEHTIEKSNIES